MLDPLYHPSKGALGAALIEAGAAGFKINPSGELPIPVYPTLGHAGAPTSGSSGTYLGVAKKGWLLIDTTNGTLYQCSASSGSSITWTEFTTASGTGSFTGNFDGVVGANTPAAATVTSMTATSIVNSGLETDSVANALTASTTQTLLGGLALTKMINRVTTVANAGDAVTLAALTAGEYQDIYNDGAHAMSVFPGASGAAIDGGSAGAHVTLTNAKRCRYLCVATNTIVSAQLGAVSA